MYVRYISFNSMYKQTEVLNQTLYLQAFKASAHLLSMHVHISLYVTGLYFTQNQIICQHGITLLWA